MNRSLAGWASAVLLVLSVAPARGQEPENKYALLIGISNYTNATSLRYASDDMLGVKRALNRSLNFPEENIKLLSDKNGGIWPSKRNIKAELNKLLARVQPKDLVLVAFAGHGQGANNRGYLLPVDAGDTADTLLNVRDDIYQPLYARKAMYKMVILDACRNDPAKGAPPKVRGGSLRARANDKPVGGFAARVEAFPFESPQPTILAWTSCNDDEFSFEDDGLGHGLFVNYLIQGLSGGATPGAQGELNASTLYEYANQQMSLRLEKLNEKQAGANLPPLRQESQIQTNKVPRYPVLGSPKRRANFEFAGKSLTAGSDLYRQFQSILADPNADLDYFDFTKSDLSGLDLSGRSLVGAWLEGAIFKGTNLKGANLTRVHARDADFSNADMSEALLSGEFYGSKFYGTTTDGWDVRFARGVVR